MHVLGLACRGFPCEVAVMLVTRGFIDNGDGYGLKRVKKKDTVR
jgi:hypothetical protein